MTHLLFRTDGVRATLLTLGVLLLAAGTYGHYLVWRSLPTDGLAGGIMAVALFSTVILSLGVTLTSLGLVFPSASPRSTIPDLGFTPRQRKYVVYGSGLLGIGPITFFVNPSAWVPILPRFGLFSFLLLVVAGFGFVLLGFGSRIFDRLFGEN